MEVSMLIYKETNRINLKVYIGLTTKTLQKRHEGHIKESLDPVKCTSYFHKAMKKYGVENFTVEVIETCQTKEELYEREKFWIKFYKSNDPKFGYNMTAGGEGSIGRVFSAETIEKIRKGVTGKTAWNKNKTKETDPRIKSSWNAGLSKETDERLKLLGQKESITKRAKKAINNT